MHHTQNGNLPPHERLAATLELRFAQSGRSLTDDDTAAVFLITLGEVRRLFQGAHEQGLIGAEEHADLDAMLEGMAAAPGLIG